jgi:hypothetical protein
MLTSQRIIWIGLAVTTIAVLALGYFLFLAPQAEKKAVTVPDMASLAIKPADNTAAAGDLDDSGIVPLDLDLDHSDVAVRDMLAAAAIPAALKGWLEQKEIVRTAVAAVDNIARGESPTAQLQFLAPAGKFLAYEKDGTLWLDPQSFRRYNPLVNAFAAIPDKTYLTWYKKLRPTLEKAFKELGYPGITFSQRIQQAVEQLTQVPLLQKEVALDKKVLSYAFADANLESLNPAQKHLLRLGPDNAARIQKKLRALAAALNPSGKN